VIVREGDAEETITVTSEDFARTERPVEGWAVASSAGETVALVLELTDALRAAGTVREVVRLVQEARKNRGLEVTDRIELWWEATGPVGEAIESAADTLAAETLAVRIRRGAPTAPLAASHAEELGVTFWLHSVS
jgi:isoleucyl-tRNA synthetase